MKTWHIVTCEYPPQIGGVSHYTNLLAQKLRTAGDVVHIWAPSILDGNNRPNPDTTVHRSLGKFGSKALSAAAEEMNALRSDNSEVLVQWVPHGYGQRSMNIGFCRWVESLSRSRIKVSLMVHEPY